MGTGGMFREKIVPILFFSLIAGIYLAGVAPDMSWMSLGGDQFDYVVAAENMRAARPTGYPLYIMVGWIFERLPGNPFWCLALLSAVSTVATAIVIFLLVRHLTKDKIAPYVGAATYAGAFIVWTQSVIPEVYTFTTFFMVLGIYLVLTKHYNWAAFVLGLGLGTHHLIGFAIIPAIVYLVILRRRKEARFSWLVLFILCSIGLLSYLQCALCVKEPVETSNGLGNIFTQTTGSTPMAFQLPLQSTPQRLWEFFMAIIVSIGIGLPTLFFLRRSREIVLLAAIALIIILYYLMSFPPQWITFLVPAMAFAACLIGIGAAYFPVRRGLILLIILPLCLIVINFARYDVGRTVDFVPTTARQLYNELDTVPDGSIVYTSVWGHGWLVTYYYCMEHDWRITLVNQGGILYYPDWYKPEIEKRGVTLPEYPGLEGSYYKNWVWSYPDFDREEFIAALAGVNPDRQVYVTVLEDNDETMVFGVQPVVHDASGSWIVPRVENNDDGGARIPRVDESAGIQ